MNQDENIIKSGFDHDIFIFLCGNRRSIGANCGSNEHDADFEDLRRFLNRYKLQLKHKVKLIKSGCLGRCGYGPNLVIFPDNIWYHYQSYDDLKEIIINHVLNGAAVDRLKQTTL